MSPFEAARITVDEMMTNRDSEGVPMEIKIMVGAALLAFARRMEEG